ncbi:MAG: lipopolysaccharide transport periplasmic protein LptA [bacterium]
MLKQLFIESIIFFHILTFFGSAKADTLLKKVEKESLESPITITSQKVDFDNQKQEAIYSGEVKVVKGDIILTADTIRVLFRGKDQSVKLIQADGRVRIWWKDRYAEAEKGIYDDQSQTLILTGSPKTWQDENMVKGDKISYNLADDRVVVEGSVETVIKMDPGIAEKVKP